MSTDLPLLRRYPALADVPRASFGSYPTPVETISVPGGSLMIKRDDLTGSRMGGNKIRGLEWVLGDLTPRERVLTVGPRGSTHALATAVCARSLGAKSTVVRWRQYMNDAARKVDARIRNTGLVFDMFAVPAAYALATSLRALPRTRWVGAGGTAPIAILGHVNAALELVEQVARRECELPLTVYAPLGTGGTVAGLALGFRIAGVSTRVVGVRVVPKAVGRLRRVLKLAQRGRRLIEKLTASRVPQVTSMDVSVDDKFYGGKYGRPLKEVPEAERLLQLTGIKLDDSYSRKTFAAATAHVAGGGARTMFWLTFDGRLLS